MNTDHPTHHTSALSEEELENAQVWHPDDYVNAYGEDWFLSSCPNHYATALAYEEGWRDCYLALQRAGVQVPAPNG